MTAAPLSELPPPAPRSSFQPGAATLPRALAGLATQSLSSVDHAWLRMDEATNLMIINGVLVLDGRVDVGRFREVVRERLLTIPRFRERVVRPGTGGRRRTSPSTDTSCRSGCPAREARRPCGR
jgi:hypothetical protein